MFKRFFWFSAGFVTAVFALSKTRAYMRAKTPQPVRRFLVEARGGDVQENGTGVARTLGTLVGEFNSARRAQEDRLNTQFADRAGRSI